MVIYDGYEYHAKTAGSVYLFAFKMDASLPSGDGRGGATAEAALAQINSQGYAIPCTADHRKLVKIGVGFLQRGRCVKRWWIA